ncbi:hypothetical protein TNCV_3196621 [Trichonephila clavipes]|nr:hypothetical protein TNCV_3196621 [Trichonephila clavipes]
MLWREMARYRVSSALRVSHLPESTALAKKGTVWPCVSLAMSVATPGLEFKAFTHLCKSDNNEFSSGVQFVRTHDGTLVSSEPVKKT